MTIIATIDRDGTARPGIGPQPILRHGRSCDCWTCATNRVEA